MPSLSCVWHAMNVHVAVTVAAGGSDRSAEAPAVRRQPSISLGAVRVQAPTQPDLDRPEA
jgi:hypothetical protein